MPKKIKFSYIDSDGSTSGQVLTSNGTAVTWGAAAAGVNVNSTYAWTNVHTFTSNVTIDELIVKQVSETINVSATAATGTIAYDTFMQSAMYLTTNASANWTPNFRANSTVSLNDAMSNGQSITVAMMVTQGATAYFSNSVQINATTSGVTTRWLGAAIPTAGDVNAIDIYTYTIIKTATNTFTVFAGLSQYK